MSTEIKNKHSVPSSSLPVVDRSILKEYAAFQERVKAAQMKKEEEMIQFERKVFPVQQPLLKQRAAITSEIPGFWNAVIQGNDDAREYAKDDDTTDVLDTLLDISIDIPSTEPPRFKITFTFGPNDYFTDTTLSLDFMDEPFNPTLINRSTIHWKEGKNILENLAKFNKSNEADDPELLPFHTIFELWGEESADVVGLVDVLKQIAINPLIDYESFFDDSDSSDMDEESSSEDSSDSSDE
ncbi:putative Nucleosome assembly protein (NAP) [Blattamonas nauphoetae]|uniref:Nucleosome assembly protein (NAP) n=1 Tax=Blattamonas nauphoetae TaxID=2049346 RepID=A0ABQ9Y7E1_9EUKA|nr:putative Nucleosome assembly protein (NAP) [Blattamonas nauphoetae]